MIAPAAFEDITFPQQSLLDWTAYESRQWMRAGQSYFTSGSGNGITYGTPATIVTNIGSTVAKYAGGALTPDGKIITCGHLEDNHLVIDTTNDNVFTTGSIAGDPSSNSSVYSPYTNKVYSLTDTGMYRMNATTYALEGPVASPWGNSQGILLGLAHNGRRIYLHGFFNSRKIYYYDVTTDTFTDTGTTFSGDRLTGCLSYNNKFYFGGAGGSTNLITYDVDANTITTFGGVSADSFRNFIQHHNGYMYTFPGYGASSVLRVSPIDNSTVNILTGITSSGNFNAYCIGADGNIYMVGQSNILGIYNPYANTFTTGTMPGSSYEGLIMGLYGDLYAIPWDSTYVAKIPIQNNGRVLRPLGEVNGIISRHQPT